MIENHKEPNNQKLENLEIKKLEEDFLNLLSCFSKDTEKIKVLFNKLVDLYSAEGRYYHTIRHIQAMLEFLERHKDKIENFDSVFLATWYHDAVYDSKSKSNELDSAEMMKQDMASLALPEEIVDSIYELIMATQKHEKKTTEEDESLFLDADLSILARPPHVYAIYYENIRKEYAWVSEEDYKTGRRNVLQSFLNRQKIYFSDTMAGNESIARKNIEDEISKLN